MTLKSIRSVLIFLCSLATISRSSAHGKHLRLTYPSARATLYFKGDTTKPVGEVYFIQMPGGEVIVKGGVRGLTPGKHGFHVHQNPSLEDDCKGAGPHFNPFGQTHGHKASAMRHVGDLGNILTSEGSSHTRIHKVDNVISTNMGESNIIGRALVVHAGEDDLGQGGDEGSLKTGNAGARVACGIIEKY
uniref:Superoxide dismutase [Cu-Zn] n=1 Tax=Caligus rogercresseyi TaxID=217165 RepID=C1BQG7_CALRO|nr:Superoxide dismutase [Caligus rogercresseyi]